MQRENDQKRSWESLMRARYASSRLGHFAGACHWHFPLILAKSHDLRRLREGATNFMW